MIYRRAKKVFTATLLMVTILVFAGSSLVLGQCVNNPTGKTALRFNNQTSYNLTFFVDMEVAGTYVPSKKVSDDREVNPGEHLLRAMAKLIGQELWVATVNDVPNGHICTWTIEDPAQVSPTLTNQHRITSAPRGMMGR